MVFSLHVRIWMVPKLTDPKFDNPNRGCGTCFDHFLHGSPDRVLATHLIGLLSRETLFGQFLRISLFLFLPLALFVGESNATNFQAKVIHMGDGDTIIVLNDSNDQIKIRLNGIDCPEKAQAYGHKAKRFTKELVAGQAVPVCEKAQEC